MWSAFAVYIPSLSQSLLNKHLAKLKRACSEDAGEPVLLYGCFLDLHLNHTQKRKVKQVASCLFQKRQEHVQDSVIHTKQITIKVKIVQFNRLKSFFSFTESQKRNNLILEKYTEIIFLLCILFLQRHFMNYSS